MLHDGKKFRILVYSQNILQDFSTSLKRLKDSDWYIQADLSSTVLMSCFYRFSTAVGIPVQEQIIVHGRRLQFQFLA